MTSGPVDDRGPEERAASGRDQSIEPDSGDETFRRAGRTTILLAAAVAIGQLVTVGREVFVAGQVGASAPLDALLIALVAPLTIGGLVQSGTAAALLAALGLIEASDGRASAMRLAGVVTTWTVIIGGAAVLAIALLARPLISLTGPGLDRETADLAASILPAVAPLAGFMALSTVGTALCQAVGAFKPIALAAVANPIVAMALTVALWPQVGVFALGIGMVFGMLTTLVVVAVGAARAGMMPRPALRATGSHVRGYLGHAVPLWTSSLALTLNLFADRAIASLLPTGSVSALRYGETIMRSPTDSLSTAWGTVAFPLLVRSAVGPGPSLGPTTERLARTVLALTVPGMIGAIALAPALVAAIFERGAFDHNAVRTTATIVACLAPMFVLTMVEAVLISAHNARRAGRTLLAAGLIHVAINVSLDLLLIHPFGVAGIAVATSTAYLGALTFLAVQFTRRESGFHIAAVLGVGFRTLLASLVPGIPVGIACWTLAFDAGVGSDLALLIVGGAIGAAGFIVIARVLRIDEVSFIVTEIAKRARRLVRRGPAAG